MVRAGAVAALCALLSDGTEVARIFSAQALGAIAREAGDDQRIHIISEGAIPGLARLLRGGVNAVQCQLVACNALQALAEGGRHVVRDLTTQLCEHGCVDHLIRIIESVQDGNRCISLARSTLTLTGLVQASHTRRTISTQATAGTLPADVGEFTVDMCGEDPSSGNASLPPAAAFTTAHIQFSSGSELLSDNQLPHTLRQKLVKAEQLKVLKKQELDETERKITVANEAVGRRKQELHEIGLEVAGLHAKLHEVSAFIAASVPKTRENRSRLHEIKEGVEGGQEDPVAGSLRRLKGGLDLVVADIIQVADNNGDLRSFVDALGDVGLNDPHSFSAKLHATNFFFRKAAQSRGPSSVLIPSPHEIAAESAHPAGKVGRSQLVEENVVDNLWKEKCYSEFGVGPEVMVPLSSFLPTLLSPFMSSWKEEYKNLSCAQVARLPLGGNSVGGLEMVKLGRKEIRRVHAFVGGLTMATTPFICFLCREGLFLSTDSETGKIFPARYLKSGAVSSTVQVAICATGFGWSAVLSTDGKLWTSKQFSRNFHLTPCVALGRRRFVSVSCGAWHVCLSTECGQVFTMGQESGEGVLGVSSEVFQALPVIGGRHVAASPVRVVCLDGWNVRRVSCGLYFSLALTTDGQLLSWGGLGAPRDGEGVESLVSLPPLQIFHVLPSQKVVCMSAGAYFFGLLAESNTSNSKGLSTYLCGALGPPSKHPLYFPRPTLIPELSVVDIAQLCCGLSQTVLLTSDGSIMRLQSVDSGYLLSKLSGRSELIWRMVSVAGTNLTDKLVGICTRDLATDGRTAHQAGATAKDKAVASDETWTLVAASGP